MFVFLSTALVGQAQSNGSVDARDYVEEMENNDLQIRQKPGTERLLSDYLGEVGMQEDTIYAVLYRPAQCIRCEVAVKAFYEFLKDNNPAHKMLLVTAYEDSATAAGYNRKHSYKADYYLYDTAMRYSEIFSFNSAGIYGLYILKLCPKSGVMITGGEFTYLGPEFVSQLVAKKQRLAPHVFSNELAHMAGETNSVAAEQRPLTNWKYKDIRVELPDSEFISSVYDVPKVENGHFFFSDMLNNGIMLFKKDGDAFKFRSLIQADESEKNRFVEVSDEDFSRLEKNGQVFYIALSANMIDNERLGISYSLPKILERKVGEEKKFCFYNSPAILIRDIDWLKPGKMIAPDFDLEHSPYFYQHFTFDVFGSRLWLGCEKLTWPMDGYAEEDISNDVNLNSFDDRFYDTFNPIVASFDTVSGKCVGQYGRLEQSQRLSKTGYYFLYPLYAHCQSDLLYGNGYTGVLYLADSSDVAKPKRKYTVFDFDYSSMPAPDSTKFYTQEYGGLYDDTFNRCITEVRMDAKRICCLVRHGRARVENPQDAFYSFAVIDRKTGKCKEYPIANDVGDSKVLGYGISHDKTGFLPFVFLRDKAGYYVRTYSVM